MANLKSQLKRNRQNEKRRLRNRNYRGAARTAVSQARAALESGATNSNEALQHAISVLDKAAERGIVHRNNAARRKGRLMRQLAKLQAGPADMKVEATTQADNSSIAENEVVEPGKKPAQKKAKAKKAPIRKPAKK